ncbi:hypothetical protein [Neisseria sp.]|uniref:hypothetical protein n=1 Tax=Neisseria sp. TaxID=192066 RepID=UPI00289D6A8C|nr:hypothetical protein [Neisseria sp.]
MLTIENLYLTKSVYFYVDSTYADPQDISLKEQEQKESKRKDLIKEILETASSNANDPKSFILNKFREHIDEFEDMKYSIRVFQTDRQVYFLKESSNQPNEKERKNFSTIKDIVYAYIVIIEYKKYICILKKSCSDISTILNKNNLNLMDLYTIGNIFSENAEYKKLSFRAITSSNQEIHSKTYYANDLKGSLSLYSAGRNIVSGMQARNGGKLLSITNTGRFTENAQRSSFEHILEWIKERIDDIETNQSSVNPFLKNFARKIKLKDIPANVTPNSLMIESIRLSDMIQESESDIFYKNSSNKWSSLNDKSKNDFFQN